MTRINGIAAEKVYEKASSDSNAAEILQYLNDG
jgi:hypothetical protein